MRLVSYQSHAQSCYAAGSWLGGEYVWIQVFDVKAFKHV